ncbi:MAG: error-prone DNA polymerase, partial [Pseudomonadota bacterium]
MMFVELSATSNFTFLTGGSHPEEMAAEAAALGLQGIAIADRNSVAGIVRAHLALRELAREAKLALREKTGVTAADVAARGVRAKGDHGGNLPAPPTPPVPVTLRALPRLIPAARLVLRSGLEVTAIPEDRAGWGRLTRLLTLGNRRAEKGECHLDLPDLEGHGEGLLLLLHPGTGPAEEAARLARRFPEQTGLLAAPRYDGRDARRFDRLAAEAEALSIPLVASAEPLMHTARRRRLTDILTCIREGVTIDRLGTRAQVNGERRLRSEADMRRFLGPHAGAVDAAAAFAARARFSLDELRYEYPDEVTAGEPPQSRL